MSSVKSSLDLIAERPLLEICQLPWSEVSEPNMMGVAWAYYYFSIQFRENLEIACQLFPDDRNLAKLKMEEIATDNLSPYPDVAVEGEALDHDEFMRRALRLGYTSAEDELNFKRAGETYLRATRSMDRPVRAASIGSYESGGLNSLFLSMLKAPLYDNKALGAFRFFMAEHIRFDSDMENGHAALSRHILDDEATEPLWDAFKELLLECVPDFVH